MLKSLIEKKMKERMSAGGGDRKSENRKIGYDHLVIPDNEPGHTTTRKEIAKIAGVGEVKFAWVRF